jgi:hypothetical protein
MTERRIGELSVAEQRYRAVLAVIGEGRTVTDVAGKVCETSQLAAVP